MSDNSTSGHQDPFEESRLYWNQAASTFDDEPDHGLRDPIVREAWTKLLRELLPANMLRVLDIGCGTGTLSMILCELGYETTGIDFSPEMIKLAKKKAQAIGHDIDFHVMDATYPNFPAQHFDAIVCRHLLWALPDRDQVLQRWVKLLKPDGHLLLIEGYWHTDAGLHAQDILDILPASLSHVVMKKLSDNHHLWGGAVNDERYAIHATLNVE